MDYTKSIVIPAQGKIDIDRPEKYGGNITYTTYEALEKDYLEGLLHPGDLKTAVALAINKLIEPVRRHFTTDPVAK